VSTIDLTQAWNESQGGSFISGEEKQKIHDTQAPIYIYDAEPNVEGQYGPQTVFHVRSNQNATGDMRLLAFTHTDQRERFARAVKILLASEPVGSAAGPVYLHKFQTKTGNDAWVIKPTKQTDKPDPAQTPKPAETKTPPARDIGDDLPF